MSLLGHVSKNSQYTLSKLTNCPNTNTLLCYYNNSFLTVWGTKASSEAAANVPILYELGWFKADAFFPSRPLQLRYSYKVATKGERHCSLNLTQPWEWQQDCRGLGVTHCRWNRKSQTNHFQRKESESRKPRTLQLSDASRAPCLIIFKLLLATFYAAGWGKLCMLPENARDELFWCRGWCNN